MHEEDLAGLPSFRVIRVSTEAQDYRGGPDGQAHELDFAEVRTWRTSAFDGSSVSIVDPPVSDTLWERVQAIRAERATPGTRSTRDRVYVPRLFCHGCGAALRGHASSDNRRMTHPATVCAAWLDASGRRTSFRAEIYEWQIAALLATARLDETAKTRIVRALQGAEPLADGRRIGRLEQELRAIALDNAFSRMSDEVYLRRKAELAAEIETARRPHPAASRIEPGRAIAYLDDLRSLWDAEFPDAPDHGGIRREYELRRARATAVAFDRLEALGPVIVEAKLSEDPLAGASLALSLEPTRAELVGDRAEVVRHLLDGRRSRLRHADTPEARKKRRQRTDDGTLRCIGRGERSQNDDFDGPERRGVRRSRRRAQPSAARRRRSNSRRERLLGRPSPRVGMISGPVSGTTGGLWST
jgi:hypothetical protein